MGKNKNGFTTFSLLRSILMKRSLHKRGFTLVELTIGILLFGLVTFLMAAIYISHYRIYSNQNTTINVASQARLALDDITNNIRIADSIVSTCTNCGSDTTGANVIILQLWPTDTNGNPQDPGSTNFDYIVYKQSPSDATQLTRKIIPSGISSRKSQTQVIASSINSLQFTYNNATPTNATEVTTQITTQSKSLGKTISSTQQKTGFLMNK